MTAASTALVHQTRAPGGTRLVILYDGSCRFCTASAKGLARRFGPSRAVATNFQEEGVLATYPGVTYEACMEKMHVIDPEGRVYSGAGAFARLFRTIPIVGVLAYLYYVPGVRQLSEIVYAFIAKNRYRLFGKTHACDPGGTCHLHQ